MDAKVLGLIMISLISGVVGGYAVSSMICQNQNLEIQGRVADLERENAEKDVEIQGLQETFDNLTQVNIGDIEWNLVIDWWELAIHISNEGTMPITIFSIGVRKNTTGSSWYTYSNPISVNGHLAIADGGSDVFIWNETNASAPQAAFLEIGPSYVVRVTYSAPLHPEYTETVTTHPRSLPG